MNLWGKGEKVVKSFLFSTVKIYGHDKSIRTILTDAEMADRFSCSSTEL